MILVPSNRQLKNVLEATRDALLAKGFARLYTNQVDPSSALVIADLFEATFPGYNAIPLADKIGNVSKLADGYYACSSVELTFSNTGIVPWRIHGVYVQVETFLSYMAAFTDPYDLLGGQVLTLTIRFDEKAISV